MEPQAENVEAFQDVESPPVTGARIDFQDISMTIQVKADKVKTILSNVSGHCAPGRLTALMGPSGSGKTSLLNSLAGRTRHVKGLKLTGTISLNGTAVTNWESYRRLCAYVEQDDLLFHTLTVTETLVLAAQLRLPRKMTYAAKMDRVNEVIAELGLRKCANTRIGNSKFRGVSGGERKRVSIALEVLRGPTVLFLDECTSGLDSFQALRVVDTIKSLAQKGRTIVTSIHQPRSSIYGLFDDLIVLSEGQLMYFGSANAMVGYFSKLGFEMPKNFNPADFALDTVSVDVRNEALEAESRARQQMLGEAIKNHVGGVMESPKQASFLHLGAVDAKEMVALPISERSYEAPIWKQFLLLAQRAVRQKVRDPSQFLAPFIIAVVFGLIIGFVYFRNGQNFSQKAIQDKAGIFFFIALNQSFNGMISVVSTFPIEKEIVNRERSSKSYAVFPYFFSKVLADIPMLICPFTFFTITYWIAGFKAEAVPFLQATLVCLMVYLAAGGIGLIASAIMPTPETAQGIAMPFMLIFALFSGFYANTDLIPAALAWIQWISPIRWAFSGFMSILMAGLKFDCPNPELEGCIPTGEAFIERLGLGGDSFARSVGVLLAMTVGFQIIGYLTLTFSKAKWMVPKH